MKPDSQPPEPAARIPEQDEAGLVARIRAGDRAGFGVLAERYAGVARRVARAVLGDPDDADDAAQDALLSALVKLDQYDPRRPFGPWLLRIVANAATDRRRRRTVRRVEQLDPALVAGGARPDATTERRALSARLVAGLLARVGDGRGAGSWDRVLARWARVGVAAAVLCSLAAGYLVGRATAAPGPSVAEALIAPRTPVVEVVLASVLGN